MKMRVKKEQGGGIQRVTVAEKHPLQNVFPCENPARPVCHRAVHHKSHLSKQPAAIFALIFVKHTQTQART